jgi:hypothetical protein
MKKLLTLVIFLFSIALAVKGQYYTSGSDPGSIRWRQIRTDRFRIIYPAPFEKKSQYLANIMDLVVKADTHSLSARVPRIPIVIHQQSAVSNGVTVWAPKRIEFYPCPPQDGYAEEWLEQLGIHEYRHAVQTAKMNRGFTKAMYCLFGEQATGAVLGLFVPTWFLEGDAVSTETALSDWGRGRIASFESVLRAQVMDKGIYRYDKAVLGSYRTFIPDQYNLGYFLVAGGRARYGSRVWDYTLDRVAKYPFMVVPFASGIKRSTGSSKVKFYRQTLSWLDTLWTAQASKETATDYRLVTKPDPRNYSLYQFPSNISDSSAVAEKSCLDDIDRFVVLYRGQKEKKICTPGSFLPAFLSYAAGVLVWTESVPDIRWENRDYAVIRTYDFRTKKVHTLTRRSRYFSAGISPDGTRISAVHIDPENRASIDILDAKSGKVLTSFSFGNAELPSTPAWEPSGKKLIFSLMSVRGKAIGSIEMATGRFTMELPYSRQEISGPGYYRNFIMFSADYSGISNIYAMDTVTRRTYRVTSSHFGASNPDFDPAFDKMIYPDYCSDGAMIVLADLMPSKWVPIEKVGDSSIKLYKALLPQETTNVQDSIFRRNIYKMNLKDSIDFARDSIKGKNYPSKRYSKFLHLFNPHSWAPASFDVSNLNLSPGISVLSQNVLGSMIAGAGYSYDVNEKTGKVYADLSYRGLYPAFDALFSYGGRSSYYIRSSTGEHIPFRWNEINFTGTVSIPWNFSHGKYYRYITPAVGISLIDAIHTSETPANFTSGLVTSMNYQLSFSNYLRSVARDMYPKWGQVTQFNFRNSPFQGNGMGSIIAFQADLYFPGLFRHHSFWIYGGIQQNKPDPNSNYVFSDYVKYPRGYSGGEDENLFSVEFNYKLPLFCPDWSIGSLLYLKRFKLNLFYDYAEGSGTGYLNVYRSTGAELTVDLHILRFLFPFDLGVRAAYIPGTTNLSWEFLYSIRY